MFLYTLIKPVMRIFSANIKTEERITMMRPFLFTRSLVKTMMNRFRGSPFDGAPPGIPTISARKLKLAVLVLVVLMGFGLKGLFAGNAYIVFRCTTTLSVELFDGGLYNSTTYYNFGDVAAADTYVSANPIGVRNNSSGIISRWEVDVPEISGANLGIDSEPGLCKMRVCVKFTTATPVSGDFDVVNDTVPYTGPQQGWATPTGPAKTYNTSNFYWSCGSYIESSHSLDASRVYPISYDPALDGKAYRHMWIRLDTPTAVEGSNLETTITLRITAK